MNKDKNKRRKGAGIRASNVLVAQEELHNIDCYI
jgi:hypothetical protein